MDDARMAVVVGGGASGALASVQLLAAGWPVALVDPQARAGRGVAYGTASPWHLLNSPVSAMSAQADQPEDFLRWCQRRCPETLPSHFVRRDWYGEYLSEKLQATDGGRLTVYRGHVSRIFEAAGGGFSVLLADGTVVPAAHVVLALGNAAPADPLRLDPAVRRSPSYVADPWADGALAGVGDGPVLLIGSGLTAYDITLSLVRARPGTEIVAVSRHGLTPQPHRREPAAGPAGGRPVEAGKSLRQNIRRLRELAEAGGDWRAVMDAHRPHWNLLWDGLSEPDQRRFLRHLARFWEVHRHRVAPTVADEITALRDSGTLHINAGEVCGLTAGGRGGLVATLRSRDGSVVRRHFAAVINCTGPGRIADSSPLVRSLIAVGLARPGPYRLGLEVDMNGALVRRDGTVNSALWTLGPPRRGVLWETTAVPEIRDQASALARRLPSPAALPIASPLGVERCTSQSAPTK